MRSRREYDRAFQKGRSRHTPHFRVVVAPSEDGVSRLGLVVSRRVGKACNRNRVKRRIREYFRTHRAGFREAVEVVVVAKPGAADLGAAEFRAELAAGLGPWLVESPSGFSSATGG